MASGFPGGGIGGGPEYYGGGRSIHGGTVTGMNTVNSDPPQSQHPYRAARLPGLFLDPIGNRSMLGLTGKRTLADFQTAQQFQNNPVGLSDLLLRSVKPRSFQNLPSPISPLTQIDLSGYNNNSNMIRNLNFLAGNPSQQLGLPFIQQSRTQLPGIGFGSGNSYPNPVQNQGQKSPDMMHQLKELEKQLLDDDDEEDNAESGAVSAITNTNSEWSETIQNLVSPNLNPNQNPNLVSSSPTPSSSSSSSSGASPVSLCSKQTILETATAITDGNYDVAAEIVARASQSLNLKGKNNNNSEQKLLKFILSAFRYRIELFQNAAPVSELYGIDHLSSTQLLCEVSPCFKLGFVAANLAILETMTADPAGENGFHVVDFDVGNGVQYVNLLEEISGRKIRPTVKITVVTINGGDGERLKTVGEMLNRVAERLGLSVRFESVACSGLADLTRDSVGCDSDEPLAVNFAYKLFRVPDESVCTENPRDVLLRRVKGLAPRLVTLVEQEINANTAPFTTRVNEAAAYYGALLDSVETTGLCGDSDRVKVEEGLSRKIANAVACEGLDRVERCEVFGKWRARMNMAGFESVPLSRTVGESLRYRLGNGERVNPGYTVKEDNGGVCLGWLGRTLTVASTWR